MSDFLTLASQAVLLVAAIAFVIAFAVVMVEIAKDAFAPQPGLDPQPVQFRHSITVKSRQAAY